MAGVGGILLFSRIHANRCKRCSLTRRMLQASERVRLFFNMRYSLRIGIILLNLGLAAVAAPATNPPPRIYRDKIEPHWFADSGGMTNKFWYRLQLAHDEKEFVLVDAAAGKR